MKQTKLFLVVVAIFAAFTLTAAAQAATNAVPQLTPEAVQAINNLMCLLPAKAWPAVALIIGLIVKFGILGRIIQGWRTAGIFGVVTGLLGGTNAPKPPGDVPKGASVLMKLLLFGAMLSALCFAGMGCKSTQVINFSKGTGLDANIPIGYNGANLFELKLKIGQFYTATAVQPIMTNALFVPSVAFASSTDGTVTAPQIGGAGNANVTGGDKFTASIGASSGSISNLVGNTTSVGK